MDGRLGNNTLRIIAYDAQGRKSNTYVTTFYTYQLPEWLRPVFQNGIARLADDGEVGHVGIVIPVGGIPYLNIIMKLPPNPLGHQVDFGLSGGTGIQTFQLYGEPILPLDGSRFTVGGGLETSGRTTDRRRVTPELGRNSLEVWPEGQDLDIEEITPEAASVPAQLPQAPHLPEPT